MTYTQQRMNQKTVTRKRVTVFFDSTKKLISVNSSTCKLDRERRKQTTIFFTLFSPRFGRIMTRDCSTDMERKTILMTARQECAA